MHCSNGLQSARLLNLTIWKALKSAGNKVLLLKHAVHVGNESMSEKLHIVLIDTVHGKQNWGHWQGSA